jgi:DNA mismatch endonuclease (patch repair protein)
LVVSPQRAGIYGKQMTDTFKRARRSEIMRNIRPKNTSTELAVRRMVHRMGCRFRLHVNELPGTPDLVFPSRKKIILVNGCFWHCHKGCKKARVPKSNVEFWRSKFLKNQQRDRVNCSALRKLGWKVFIVWQCELRNPTRLERRLDIFLHSGTYVNSGGENMGQYRRTS